MKVIIAEKPSYAMNIIAAIGKNSFKRKDGYFENDEYIVTWAFGHLFGLIDVEEYYPDYDPEEKYSWDIDQLPFYPDKFRFALKKDVKTKKIDSGVNKQYNTIKKLISRNDVTSVINAGDADREGEIIVRLVLGHAGNKKPVERLWVPDQTPETIKDCLGKMVSDTEYNNLANEGMARTFIDWLYGINLTRYATLKSGTLLRVGRVIVPIVKAIYDRDMEIRNFVPEKYFSIVSAEETFGEEVKLTSKTTFKENELDPANELCAKYNASKAYVTDTSTERKTLSAGKLYSLSKLQGVLGKRYKMGLKESSTIIQKLYEAGYVTYPRTNTEYLATTEKDKIKGVIKVFADAGEKVAFKDSSIFNDSKIESHSAITPTKKVPKEGELSDKEQKVYDTIKNRFLAVFCSEPCLVDNSVITIDVGGYEIFTLKGSIMIQKGWMQYDTSGKKDKILPNLKKGDEVNINFAPVEKETTPPDRYTTDTFGKYLDNPFRKENAESDDEEYKAILSGLGLGTEATRTSIISNAISSGYISHKNDVYYIEDPGIYYIETLSKLYINMDKYKTAELGKALKSIYKGDMNIPQSIELVKEEINEILSHKDVKVESADAANINSIGNCPVCGKSVKKQTWGYSCSGYKDGCKFSVNAVIAGKKISESQVKVLLTNGKTGTIKGFKSKAGKTFDAKLKLEEGKISFDFDTLGDYAQDTECKCPNCQGKIENTTFAWKCENSCGFSVNHSIAGKNLTLKNLEDLIQNGSTDIIKGFTSKNGKKFNAKLVLDDDNKKTKFEF